MSRKTRPSRGQDRKRGRHKEDIERLATRVETAEAEVERLRSDKDERDWRTLEIVTKRAEAAEARCARLQQALEPYFGRDGTLHPPLDIRSIESLREIDDKIREALAGPDTPAPKARRESTYTVSWERRDYPEYGHLSCSGLTGRVAFARLIGAVKNSGPVVIHKIEREEGE